MWANSIFDANSSLFHAAVSSMARRAPQVLARFEAMRLANYFPTRVAKAPGPLLFDITGAFLDRCGPGATFDAFAECFENYNGPTLDAILAARDPVGLLRRVQAIEQIGMRGSFTMIASVGSRCVSIRRESCSAEYDDNLAYSLGYWGFLAGLLRTAGCRDLRLEIPGKNNDWLTVYSAGYSATGRFAQMMAKKHVRISWSSFAGRDPVSGVLPFPVLQGRTLARLITQDLKNAFGPEARAPAVPQLAHLHGKSSRSLQRSLAATGLSVRDLRTALRMQRAGRLIIDSDRPLADISFEAGFSDASHLSREFRRLLDITPHSYRQISRL